VAHIRKNLGQILCDCVQLMHFDHLQSVLYASVNKISGLWNRTDARPPSFVYAQLANLCLKREPSESCARRASQREKKPFGRDSTLGIDFQ